MRLLFFATTERLWDWLPCVTRPAGLALLRLCAAVAACRSPLRVPWYSTTYDFLFSWKSVAASKRDDTSCKLKIFYDNTNSGIFLGYKIKVRCSWQIPQNVEVWKIHEQRFFEVGGGRGIVLWFGQIKLQSGNKAYWKSLVLLKRIVFWVLATVFLP